MTFKICDQCKKNTYTNKKNLKNLKQNYISEFVDVYFLELIKKSYKIP